MNDKFVRSALLLGEDNIEKLKNKKVAIFGIGGVGSYVVEALSRMGIGKFILVDADKVDVSNINRQLIATNSTIGMPKVLVAKNRILDINPSAEVITYEIFYNGGDNIPLDSCDYIVDAIDTVSAKIALAKTAKEKSIKIISAMGAGNKLDPTRFEVSDIYKTVNCPLCRVMRRELRKLDIKNLKVVYSKEEPIKPVCVNSTNNTESVVKCKRQTPGSVSFVPSVCGLIIASEVIKDLIHIDNN